MTAKAPKRKRPPVDRSKQSTDDPVFCAKFRGLKLRPEQLQAAVNCEVIVEVFKVGRSWYAQARGATAELDVMQGQSLYACQVVDRIFAERIGEWQAYRRGQLVKGFWSSIGDFIEERPPIPWRA